MKSPIVIADIWGMPPVGFGVCAAIVLGLAFLCIAQIRSMVPLVRQGRLPWYRIIRVFFLGLGDRFGSIVIVVTRQIGKIAIAAFCGYIGMLALIFLTKNAWISYSGGGILALLIWFGSSAGGGDDDGSKHERGRRSPTHREV